MHISPVSLSSPSWNCQLICIPHLAVYKLLPEGGEPDCEARHVYLSDKDTVEFISVLEDTVQGVWGHQSNLDTFDKVWFSDSFLHIFQSFNLICSQRTVPHRNCIFQHRTHKPFIDGIQFRVKLSVGWGQHVIQLTIPSQVKPCISLAILVWVQQKPLSIDLPQKSFMILQIEWLNSLANSFSIFWWGSSFYKTIVN